MKIFGEHKLRDFLNTRKATLREEVEAEDKNRLLNSNEVEYIDYLVSEYRIEPLSFQWDAISVSDREDDVPVRPSTGHSYRKQVITYHLPFSGAAELLKLIPSRRIVWTTDVEIRGHVITFDVINWRDDPREVKNEADGTLSKVREQAGYADHQVTAYNDNLGNFATRVVKNRKGELLKQSNLLASLGVPLKKSESVPSTFAIPVPKKRTVVRKPNTSDLPYAPEPSLDSSTYQEILGICYDTGIEIERHPSIYEGKDEETLRDHFLMVLSPHFESVTGETFNRNGKTDILIRHESANVFVAECKFWGGLQHHYKTIDQVLGYLTWRDSKAAVLCFVRNKRLGPVLEQVEMETENHPCFVKSRGKIKDGWFQFDFHLPEDDTRGVHLVILCFHFPSRDA